MSNDLTRDLADRLRRESSELCATIDRAIQAGYRPEHVQEWVAQIAAETRPAPFAMAMISAYLCDIDPDFRRAEEARAAEAWSWD